MKSVMLFLGLGTLFLIMGTYCFMLHKGLSLYEIAYILLFEASIIFFTATIIERLLLKEFGNKAVETMKKLFQQFSYNAQNSITQQLNRLFQLFKSADYNGIRAILPPRRDNKINPTTNRAHNELTISTICDSLDNTKNVKILCVSGREFLSERLGGEFFWGIFLKKARENDPYNIQILMADPDGYGSKARAFREKPDRSDYIKTDVENALVGKEELEKAWKEEGIERKDDRESSQQWYITNKFYNFIPQAWFIITDKEIFIEPYHMAGKDLKSKFHENFTDFDPCSGGRIPIFVAEKGTTLYEAFNEYFDWLWEHSDLNVFKEEFAEYFNVRDEIQIVNREKKRDQDLT